MKLGSLFDGIAGFPLAASQVGIEPVWASEIEPFPIRVSSYRFPLMNHLGSVTGIHGGAIEPVDVITFGAPCQDLSVAGKRAGMEEGSGTRSSLFYEATRIIREMREATNGRYPRFAVYENVPGALNSRDGRDFAAVLRDLADCGALDIAWRVLDARFFGVAQRRRRVFVVADFGGECAREVLFERESVRGNPAPGREAREDVAGTLGGGSGSRGWAPDTDRMTFVPVLASTLQASAGHHGYGSPRGDGSDNLVPVQAAALTASMQRYDADTETLVPVAFSSKDHGADATLDLAPTLRAMEHDGSHANGGGQLAVAYPTARSAPHSDTREWLQGMIDHASPQEANTGALLRALRDEVGAEAFTEWGLGVSRELRAAEVLRPEVHGSGVRREAGQGQPLLGDGAPPREEAEAERTVRAVRQLGERGRSPRGRELAEQLARELGEALPDVPQPRAQATRLLLGLWEASEGLGPLREALSAVQDLGRPADGQAQPAHQTYGVRRLTPVEAERLQGFPDGWTDVPDEKGKPAADGPRYRALGNSVAVPCVRWFMQRIARVLQEVRS